MVEEQFGTFLVSGDISELVADYKVVFLKAVLQPGQFVLASLTMVSSRGTEVNSTE